MSTTISLTFTWRGLEVTGTLYKGDEDDAFATSFDVEAICCKCGADVPDVVFEFLTEEYEQTLRQAAEEATA